jgi:hypothetical protein
MNLLAASSQISEGMPDREEVANAIRRALVCGYVAAAGAALYSPWSIP